MKTFGDILRMCQSEGYVELVTYFSKKNLIPTMLDDVPCSECADLPMSLQMDFYNGKFHFVYRCMATASDREDWGFKQYNCHDCGREKSPSEVCDKDSDDGEETFNWISESKFSDSTDLEKILKVIYWLVRQEVINHEQIGLECKTSKQHVKHLENYFKTVLNQWLVKKSHKIGGEGKIVEIFEQTDDNILKGKIVIGIEKKSGNYFIVPMENCCDADNLAAVINEWILPDTTVKSNLWEKLNSLKTPGFEKLKEKNLINFQGQKKEKVESTFNAYAMFKKAAEGKDPFDMFWNIVAELQCPISKFTATAKKDKK